MSPLGALVKDSKSISLGSFDVTKRLVFPFRRTDRYEMEIWLENICKINRFELFRTSLGDGGEEAKCNN